LQPLQPFGLFLQQGNPTIGWQSKRPVHASSTAAPCDDVDVETLGGR
jgi:hypothetical protein